MSGPKVLVVGAGAIGGVVAGTLLAAGHDVSVFTTNTKIAAALRENGFRLKGVTKARHAAPGTVFDAMPDARFDYVLLATQPPQVEEAAGSAVQSLAPGGRMVCFQNGLCEERVAKNV